MGLAERRGVEEFKNNDYPGWKSRIDQAAGYDVPIEVNWEELAVDDYASSYSDYFPKVYFQPLADALGAIAADDYGKSALREGLSKIVIRNTNEFYSSSGISFANGVLTFDHKPHANIGDGEDRAKGLRTKLEAGL
jgi:hypothetical protein